MEQNFFSIGWIFIALAIIYTITNKTIKSAEKKAYETMLISPNDTTVSNYIKAFWKSSGRILRVGPGMGTSTETEFTNSQQANIQDKLRQAQGYKKIVNSPNVSDPVKEQLRKAFIAKGVPILISI
ncbi:MAG: hypothetical protein IJS60_04205 [Abditibacteriota bacterium]|nr:hypothetical protein [Abditibacteriota bacterium]